MMVTMAIADVDIRSLRRELGDWHVKMDYVGILRSASMGWDGEWRERMVRPVEYFDSTATLVIRLDVHID